MASGSQLKLGTGLTNIRNSLVNSLMGWVYSDGDDDEDVDTGVAPRSPVRRPPVAGGERTGWPTNPVPGRIGRGDKPFGENWGKPKKKPKNQNFAR